MKYVAKNTPVRACRYLSAQRRHTRGLVASMELTQQHPGFSWLGRSSKPGVLHIKPDADRRDFSFARKGGAPSLNAFKEKARVTCRLVTIPYSVLS